MILKYLNKKRGSFFAGILKNVIYGLKFSTHNHVGLNNLEEMGFWALGLLVRNLWSNKWKIYKEIFNP